MAFALVLVAVPTARAQTTSTAPLAPKASILVDADTGMVIEGVNIHEPLPPASLSKIFTALTAVDVLGPDDTLTVSARAAGMPAHNLNMKDGQVWRIEDVLGALLVSSANDAGMALAERVAGTAEAFAGALSNTATRLGLTDSPTLQDPSGLDDEFSINGGNRVSARDMAVAARAVLAQPRLAHIVGSAVYSFTGGDGIAHRLGNHNRLLKVYPGAVGMKTGYTKRSLHSLVAAATRNGRTMIAVLLDAPGDTYGPAGAMLDKGFATPVSAESAAGRLPAVPQPRPTHGVAQVGSSQQERAKGAPKVITVASAMSATKHSRGWIARMFIFLFKLALGFSVVIAVLRVRAVRRQDRNRGTREKTYRVPPRPKPAAPAVVLAAPAPTPAKAASAADEVTAPVRKVLDPVRKMLAPVAPSSPAPAPARPVEPARSGPRPARPERRERPQPAHRRKRHDPAQEIDPKLARRFEILARTGQVVND